MFDSDSSVILVAFCKDVARSSPGWARSALKKTSVHQLHDYDVGCEIMVGP